MMASKLAKLLSGIGDLKDECEMENIGLRTGVRDVWQQQLLTDFTITVQDAHIQVHKVILASVSHFFRDMFTTDSSTDQFEIQGATVKVVKQLIKFIYTGDARVMWSSTADILELSMSLQMPAVNDACIKRLDSKSTKQLLERAVNSQMPKIVDACIKRLKTSLSSYNYIEYLQLFVKLQLEGAVQDVKDFVNANIKDIRKSSSMRSMKSVCLEEVQMLVENWDSDEVKAFQLVESWLSADDNRRPYTNDLMSRVRFCLMSETEVAALTEHNLYKTVKGPWCELVDKACTYHTLPINHRVLDDSAQSQVRADPTPLLFTQISYHNCATYISLNEDKKWELHNMSAAEMPKFPHYPNFPVGIEVNNFYIVCTRVHPKHSWHIFDPRVGKWFKMANVSVPQYDFALVHHGKNLYAIGGKCPRTQKGSRVERYSFESNTWTPFVRLPVYITGHAACVLGDTIYVSGGYDKKYEQDEGNTHLQDTHLDDSDYEHEFHGSFWMPEHDFFLSSRLYSLDLSSPTPKWTKLKSCPQRLNHHKMWVMKIDNEDVVAVLDETKDVCLYHPTTDKWTKDDLTFAGGFYDRKNESSRIMLSKGDSFFLMNMFACADSLVAEEEEERYREPYCALWTLTENGHELVKEEVQNIPFEPYSFTHNTPFGAMLSLAPSVRQWQDEEDYVGFIQDDEECECNFIGEDDEEFDCFQDDEEDDEEEYMY